MDITGLSSIFDLGKDLIDRLIPDPAQKAQAQLQLLTMQQQGDFKAMDNQLETMKTALSAINTEGASQDKWTSRARPAFLYVIYMVILTGLPLSILSIWFPGQVHQVSASFGDWVRAIPDSLMTLFGTGYLGYVGNSAWQTHVDGKVKIAKAQNS